VPRTRACPHEPVRHATEFDERPRPRLVRLLPGGQRLPAQVLDPHVVNLPRQVVGSNRPRAPLLVDRRRADQRRTRRDDHWTEATRGTVADISNAPSIERTLIARDQLRRVDQAIDALGERTASIFRSYRIDGLHQREIAAMTGISLSAVEKHLQKAYQAMVNIRREFDADLPSARRRDGEGREE